MKTIVRASNNKVDKIQIQGALEKKHTKINLTYNQSLLYNAIF